jgi:hypothetical protein
MTIISAFRSLRQEDCEFEASLNYILRPCQKGKRKRKREKESRKGEREREREKRLNFPHYPW